MTKKDILLSVQFKFTMRRPDDFLNVVRFQCENLPEYLPTKWGFVEPLRHIFDPSDIYALNPNNKFNIMEPTFWHRSGKNRATGSWSPQSDMCPSTGLSFHHADIWIMIPSISQQQKLILFIKKISAEFPIAIAFIEALTAQYKPYGQKNGAIEFGWFGYTTHRLRHWLPDIPWCSVFGSNYIELFGKDVLLSAPAYRTEILNDEAIFMQLTPDMDDLWNNFDAVMNVREKVKQHLGYDAFYQPERGYDWREHPELAGKIFRVPTFNFIEDGTPPLHSLVTWVK